MQWLSYSGSDPQVSIVYITSFAHIYKALVSRNPHDLDSSDCIFCFLSCGTCKESSFSGFDLLLRISLGGE